MCGEWVYARSHRLTRRKGQGQQFILVFAWILVSSHLALMQARRGTLSAHSPLSFCIGGRKVGVRMPPSAVSL